MNSQLLIALAPYVVPVLVALLTPIVTYAVNTILSKLPINQRAIVSAAVHTGVTAAEQMADATLNGPGKKQMALELIEKQLATWHIAVPSSVVNAMVEEAVYTLKPTHVDTKGV